MQEPKTKIILFEIQPNVRLTSKDNLLILEVKEEDVWKEKFYYGWLTDALRGYILYALKEFAKQDISGDIRSIADKIEQLDRTISESSNKMHKTVVEYYSDPVEQIISKHNDEDENVK